MRASSHVFLNSNRWYSAVSDYCLQLMAWLRIHGSGEVLFISQANGPLVGKAKKIGIDFLELPLFPVTFFSTVKVWRALSRILNDAQRNKKHIEIVWTFEGHEHTIAAFHRKLNLRLWGETRLVRVRGQAAFASDTAMNRWLYGKASHAVVFVANVVRERVACSMPESQAVVFPYCADFSAGVRPWEVGYGNAQIEEKDELYFWKEDAHQIDFSQTVFLVVGRYDPVKGHESLLKAFAKMDTLGRVVQLVFVGCSENVKSLELFDTAKRELGGKGQFAGTRGAVLSPCGLKRFFICDERFADVAFFVKKAHWGLIPSLGSEVICRVAVEFLQNGTPCVASDVGALREILEGSPSKIVKAGDVGEWTRALESANGIAYDSAFFPFVRKQCARFGLSQYSWHRYAELVSRVRERGSH